MGMRSRWAFRVVWPPHVCTKEPAPLCRGANGAKATAEAPLPEPVLWVANAQER